MKTLGADGYGARAVTLVYLFGHLLGGLAITAPAPEAEIGEPTTQLESLISTKRPVGFAFGSYGRVSAGTDLRGSTPSPISVVNYAPRIVEDAYVELDLYYGMRAGEDWYLRLVTTPAFQGDLFHYNGEFSASLALRNLFAEFTHQDTHSLWVGSRMYRGDDIYLLNFWPLDNLNILGAGYWFTGDRFDGGVALGVNRVLNDFQFQEVEVPARLQGSDTVVQLDRQRFIASLKGSYRLLGEATGPALKLKLNAEFHGLPAGEVERPDETLDRLPGDFGWTLGAQLGAWGFAERTSHVNLIVRYSQGLEAFGDTAIPHGLNNQKQTFPSAQELLLALSANYEVGRFSFLAGGYLRYFQDADADSQDVDDGWEGAIDIRPAVTIFKYMQVAADISYQQRFPQGPSPVTLEVLNPAVLQLAPMLIFSPFGAGAYTRPQIRFVYRAAYLNEGARDLYPVDDDRRDRAWVHFVGAQAEWWFNSASLVR